MGGVAASVTCHTMVYVPLRPYVCDNGNGPEEVVVSPQSTDTFEYGSVPPKMEPSIVTSHALILVTLINASSGLGRPPGGLSHSTDTLVVVATVFIKPSTTTTVIVYIPSLA
jgi:hypothetical protein